MAKIIGNTTATPNPRPDWNQTDSTKADYIKNKPEILTETDVKQIIAETGGAGGGGSFIVDDTLSPTSENPVQNKVVNNALDNKQDKLTFDETPTNGSQNPVTSQGIFLALSDMDSANYDKFAPIETAEQLGSITSHLQSFEEQVRREYATIDYVDDEVLALENIIERKVSESNSGLTQYVDGQFTAFEQHADTKYATLEQVGDIETALDSIIAIQNSLIGGDSV